MNVYRWLAAGVALFWMIGVSAQAPATPRELSVQTQGGTWATPYGVRIERNGEQMLVVGKIRKNLSNPSRRLSGQVITEVLDAQGNVLAVHRAKPMRLSPASHTNRASFAIQIGLIPDNASAVRVAYR